jgi:putative selenium metabolism hydrolase
LDKALLKWGRKKLNQKRKEIILNAAQALIRAVGVSGAEKEAVETAKYQLQKLGFEQLKIDKYGSLIGKIKGKRPGPKLLLDAHIDTVGVDESEWSQDPFGAQLKNGRLYGRGSSDMKGALAAMLTAAAFFAEDNNFSGEIYLSAVVFEELFEGVAARNISELINPDYVIIGEASDLKIMRGQRGRAEIVVETEGISAHSSNPAQGKNAVYDMLKLVEEIKKLEVIEDEFLGKAIMEVTDIKSSPYPGSSVIPNKCRVTYDRRLLLGESRENVLAPIKQLIDDLGLQAKAFFAVESKRCWTGNKIEAERFFPAWEINAEQKLVQAAVKGLSSTGLEAELAHYSFCTNGSHYAGEKSIPTIGFGPSKESLAHTADEYIELDQLYQAVRAYYSLIKELLKN